MTAFDFRRDWPGEDVHGGGVGADGGGVYPGAVVADAEVVDEVAGLEVVGAVEDDVGGEEVGGVGWDEVGDVGGDADAGVDAGEMAAGGFGFGESGAGVVFVEEHLALEVGGLDEVAVYQGKPADASAGKEAGRGCAGGSYADDGDVGAGEELLAGFADAGEEDLAGVAVLIGDGSGDWVGDGSGDWIGDGSGISCVGGRGVVGGKRRHIGEYTFGGGESGGGRASARRTRGGCVASVKWKYLRD